MPTITSGLREELKQTRPFHSPAHEAVVSILRTAALLQRHLALVVERGGVSLQQYNVLRILRGAGATGLCRNEVRDRLVAQVPDVTRLLDRMEEGGLVARERDPDDRRLVNTRITRAGVALLERLEAPIAELHRRQLGHLGQRKLRELIALLAEARRRP